MEIINQDKLDTLINVKLFEEYIVNDVINYIKTNILNEFNIETIVVLLYRTIDCELYFNLLPSNIKGFNISNHLSLKNKYMSYMDDYEMIYSANNVDYLYELHLNLPFRHKSIMYHIFNKYAYEENSSFIKEIIPFLILNKNKIKHTYKLHTWK